MNSFTLGNVFNGDSFTPTLSSPHWDSICICNEIASLAISEASCKSAGFGTQPVFRYFVNTSLASFNVIFCSSLIQSILN